MPRLYHAVRHHSLDLIRVVFDGYGSDGGTGVDTVYLCPDGSFDRLVDIERVIASTLGCT